MSNLPQNPREGRTVLIIFVKEPASGQVKTRLSPSISPQAAARLYGQFLEDVLEEMAQLPEITMALAYTPESAQSFFQNLVPPESLLVAQASADLGERLIQACDWGFTQGFETVLIRNSDSPDLPGSLVMEAKKVLEGGRAQVVLGPCPDGGYYLVGLKSPQPQLFQGIIWSSPTVLADTLAQAEHLGFTVHLLPSWLDIDTIADLQAFVRSPKTRLSPGWRSYRLAQDLLAGL